MIELVHPSANSSPQSNRQMGRFSRFCTAYGRKCLYFTMGAPIHQNIFQKSCLFGKNDLLRGNFQNFVPKGFTASRLHVLCANFVKSGRPEVGEIARCLPDNKNSARSLALASALIAPKMCHGQRQTMYSECPKFRPNRFTSGGVIAKRVNTVQTRHKVFPILGEIQLLRRVISAQQQLR